MERIELLRREIDGIDQGIIRMIEERIKVVKKIGEIKRGSGMEIEDVEREVEIIERLSDSSSLMRGFIDRLFRQIIEYCKNEE